MVTTQLASVGSAALDAMEFGFPFALGARWVISVTKGEDFVQTSVVIREVSAEVADCVPWLHPLSIRMIYLFPRDNYVKK